MGLITDPTKQVNTNTGVMDPRVTGATQTVPGPVKTATPTGQTPTGQEQPTAANAPVAATTTTPAPAPAPIAPAGTTTTATSKTTVKKDPFSVSERVGQIIDSNSPLMTQAETRGRQNAEARGLLNSSLGVQAGQAALYDAAMPMANADAANALRQYETDKSLAATKANAAANRAASASMARAQIEAARVSASAQHDFATRSQIAQYAGAGMQRVNAIQTDSTPGKYHDQPIGTITRDGQTYQVTDRQYAVMQDQQYTANYIEGYGRVFGIPDIGDLFPAAGNIGEVQFIQPSTTGGGTGGG